MTTCCWAMSRDPAPEKRTNAPREAFILALSLLSILNIALAVPWGPLSAQQQVVIQSIEGALTLLFLADFGAACTPQSSSASTSCMSAAGWICWEAFRICACCGCSGSCAPGG